MTLSTMRGTSTASTSNSRPRLGEALGCGLLLFLLGACDRFPRTNPFDPENPNNIRPDSGFELKLSDLDPMVFDPVSLSDSNNNDGVADPGETVRVSVFVTWTDPERHVLVVQGMRPLGDGSCVASVKSQTSTLELQPGSEIMVTTFGPFEVTLVPDPCEAGAGAFVVELEDLSDQNIPAISLSPAFAVSRGTALIDGGI